ARASENAGRSQAPSVSWARPDRATRWSRRRTMPRSSASLFQLVLIKPTHYDDDGYPIQWFRSAIPSNTLACLNGLAEDVRRRRLLRQDVVLLVASYEATNRVPRQRLILQQIRGAGGRA